MDIIEKLHSLNLQCAADYRKKELELINLLQQFSAIKGYLFYDCTSLFQYAVTHLGLSESKSYELISIARKAAQVPELKTALAEEKINTGQARRLVSIINSDNHAEWIERAANLPQRELEKKIVEAKPKEAVKDKWSYVLPTRVKLECGISEELMKQIERVQDLVSQSSGRAATLEDALQVMADLYLQKKDPVEKAKKTSSELFLRREGKSSAKRTSVPASVKRAVMKRDEGRCTYIGADGKRCRNKRWVDLHHKKRIIDGGGNDPKNIVTLCRVHHKWHHRLVS